MIQSSFTLLTQVHQAHQILLLKIMTFSCLTHPWTQLSGSIRRWLRSLCYLSGLSWDAWQRCSPSINHHHPLSV